MSNDFDDATQVDDESGDGQPEGVFGDATCVDERGDVAREVDGGAPTVVRRRPEHEEIATAQRTAPKETSLVLPATVIRHLGSVKEEEHTLPPGGAGLGDVAEARGAAADRASRELSDDHTPVAMPVRDSRPSRARLGMRIVGVVTVLSAGAYLGLGGGLEGQRDPAPAAPTAPMLASSEPELAASDPSGAEALAPLDAAPLETAPPSLPEAAALVVESRFAEAARAYAALAREDPSRRELATMARILRQKAAAP